LSNKFFLTKDLKSIRKDFIQEPRRFRARRPDFCGFFIGNEPRRFDVPQKQNPSWFFYFREEEGNGY
jgi:hypothetical protein